MMTMQNFHDFSIGFKSFERNGTLRIHGTVDFRKQYLPSGILNLFGGRNVVIFHELKYISRQLSRGGGWKRGKRGSSSIRGGRKQIVMGSLS